MLVGLLALVILILKLFPETPFARLLHGWLVEAPLARASSVRRTDVLLILILLVAGQSFMLAGSVDVAVLYATDLSFYVDAAIAASFAAAAASLRTRWATFKAVSAAPFRRDPRRAPRPRSRRSRPLPRISNDHEPAPLAA
jgi:hypothetical protein